MMLRDCRETFEDATLQDEDGGRGYESRNGRLMHYGCGYI